MDVSQLRKLVEEILPEGEEARGNVTVYAAGIPEPRLASPILRALGEASPLPQLPHVKRIRKTQAPPDGVPHMSILLCPAAEVASIPGSETVVFPEAVGAVMQRYGLTYFLAEVPRRPARTLEESRDDCKVWPVTFHPNREGAGPVKQELTDEDLRSMWRFMQEALKQAKKAKDCGQPPNGCVIVDSATQRVIASGFDHSGRERSARKVSLPLSRPRDQQTPPGSSSSGPAEDLSDSFGRPNGSERAESGAREHNGVGRDVALSKVRREEATSVEWHPLKHAAIVAVDAAAEADRRQFPDFGRFGVGGAGDQSKNGGSSGQDANLHTNPNGASCSSPINSTVIGPSNDKLLSPKRSAEAENGPLESGEKRRKPGLQTQSVETGVFAVKPYLCTGFDAYLVREPCTMCAMALVHCRVRRVIYGIANARTGALGGQHNLQSKRSLNHHYSVFQLNLDVDQESRLTEKCLRDLSDEDVSL